MSKPTELFCSRCREKARVAGKSLHGSGAFAYGRIELLGWTNEKKNNVWCKCLRCGYKYDSTSQTAIELMDKQETQSPHGDNSK